MKKTTGSRKKKVNLDSVAQIARAEDLRTEIDKLTSQEKPSSEAVSPSEAIPISPREFIERRMAELAALEAKKASKPKPRRKTK